MPYYREIGGPFFEELQMLLEQGRHVALLGPREGGKSLVLSQVRRAAGRRPLEIRPRVVQLRWRGRRRNAEHFLRDLAERLGVPDSQPGGGHRTLAGRLEDLFRQRAERCLDQAWVFVQDVLGFPAPMARDMLRAFQACYEDLNCRSRMAVIVTGETDFLPLTYETTSPYRHATQFLVSGVDRRMAAEFFCRRRMGQPIGMPLAAGGAPPELEDQIEPAAFDYLYHQTGGNPHLLQEIIVSAGRYPHPLRHADLTRPWGRREAEKCVGAFLNRFMAEDYSSRRTLRDVERNPEAFDLLLDIVAQGDGRVVIPGLSPHPLEVSGVVYRDEERRAHIACPIWRRFLERLRRRQRLADVYARQHRWDKAWSGYEGAPRRQRDRPISGEPSDRLRSVLSEWQKSLGDYVLAGPAAVCRQFFLGARHLLGFDAGWLCDLSGAGPRPLSEDNFGRLNPNKHLRLTGRGRRLQDEDGLPYWLDHQRLRLRSELGPALASAPHWRPALFLKRSGVGRAIDTSDQRLLARVLSGFWRAYRNADLLEHRKSIGELRERHLRVIERVNALLVEDPFDMGRVVQGAADALVDLGGYYRVLICLIDAKQAHIQAVTSRCRDGAQNFNYRTNFPLRQDTPEEDWDIQQWVALKGEACVVPDASSPSQRSPRTQHENVSQIGMKAIAVVPMKVQGAVLGTIHFERAERDEPSTAERQLFDVLAGQIAVAFHLARRLTLLQESVMKLRDQILIFNPRGRSIFLNGAAAQNRPGAAPGWQPAGGEGAPPADAAELEMIEEVAQSNELTHHYRITGEGGATRASDCLMAPIDDFRAKCVEPFEEACGRIGYVERILDLTTIYNLYESLQSWLATDDAKPTAGAAARTAEAILPFFGAKGFAWCRIYLLRTDGGRERLQGLAEYGLAPSPAKADFASGKVQFPRDGHPQPWHVLLTQKNEPCIYEFREGHPDSAAPTEASDLEGKPRFWTNDRKYRELFGKTDLVWIEAPLRLGGKNLGIISLAKPDRLLPEDWELLKSAVLAVSVALANALRAEELALANKNLIEFFFMMHHDLKTPLSLVIRYAEALRADRQLGEARLTVVQTILGHANDLSSIIDEELEWGRIEAGEISEDLRAFDLLKMLNELRLGFALQAKEKGLKLRVEHDEQVPVLVRGEPVKLKRALGGLLSNAVKYTDVGEVELRVTLSNGHLRFVVEDTGPGIPEDKLALVFEMWKRVRGSRRVTGHGVGLRYCKAAVRSMGGELKASTPLGKGSIFTFSIPLQAADEAEVQHLRQLRRAVRLKPGQPAYRILVVDDEDESATLLSAKLSGFGFETREAHSGEQAVRAWEEWRPRLIFMDVKMEGLSGPEATTRIKRADAGNETAVIALTANPLKKRDRAEYHAVGFAECVSQCADEEFLVQLLVKHLGVEFDSEEIRPARTPAEVRQLLTPDDVRGLPPDIVTLLREAASDGDRRAAREANVRLGEVAPELAARLSVLIEHHDLDSIELFLAEGDE
jgi:signal transduction histidine kinase